MTPAEWDDHVRTLDPRPLVKAAWPSATVRRRRLFLIALHLRGGYEPADPWEQHILRVAEKAAGGYIGQNHLSRESYEASRHRTTGRAADADAAYWGRRWSNAVSVLIEPTLPDWAAYLQPLDHPLRESGPDNSRPGVEWLGMSLDLIRCIFGDPTRPVRFDPGWKTPAVVQLARAIDAGRAYHHLPVLADALDDAGCEDERVLGHCRDDRTHAPGCWVVDGLTGKG